MLKLEKNYIRSLTLKMTQMINKKVQIKYYLRFTCTEEQNSPPPKKI